MTFDRIILKKIPRIAERYEAQIVPLGRLENHKWYGKPNTLNYSIDGCIGQDGKDVPGCFFHEELAGPDGAEFVIFAEDSLTGAEVDACKRWIRNHGDVVRLKVIRIVWNDKMLEKRPASGHLAR